MRRTFALIASALLCLVVAAPVAAKGPPTISRLDPTVLDADLLAGTCDFPVEVVDSFSSSKEMLFEADASGDQLVRFTGGYVSTITNLATDASREIRYFGAADYVFHADGTVDISTSGTILVWIYPEDVESIFDPGIYLVTGRMHFLIDSETFFSLEPERVKGRIVDLCAALS
jgi:hypothetical protein